MAEEHKAVDVVAPVANAEMSPVVAPLETTAVETGAPATEDKPVDAAEETEAAEEDMEVKPVEEGFLNHKAQGASFPKNLIASKTFFFFGTRPVEPESLATYKKTEKATGTAQHNIAWAAHTAEGLLFVGDKKSPSNIINLADATEPETDGSNKFYFTHKGNKHSLKAASTAERDSWVAQLKAKIAVAKELVATVTESEIYKQTIESFKPVAKVDAPKEEPPRADDHVQTDESIPKEDDLAKEDPKRRSASRKRGSLFGFGKKEERKEEPTAEDVSALETPKVVEPTAEATDVVALEAPVADALPETEVKATEELHPESPKEKPNVSKRNSFFGSVFSKKEKKVAEAKAEAAENLNAETAPAETAPVIPPVEATTPLGVDVSNATVPAETSESPVNSEIRKDLKEKRKSSLPFVFGKRDKSPAPVEGEERASKSAFSKLRATIKGKNVAKAEEKPVEAAKDAAAGETAATEEASKEKTVDAEAGNTPENVATATPIVTAAA